MKSVNLSFKFIECTFRNKERKNEMCFKLHKVLVNSVNCMQFLYLLYFWHITRFRRLIQTLHLKYNIQNVFGLVSTRPSDLGVSLTNVAQQ